MDIQRLRSVLATFTREPEDIAFEKGTLILQLHNDLVEVQVGQERGALAITENGKTFRAEDWIVDRVARLPHLADRILAEVAETPHFVIPSGMVQDAPELSIADELAPVEDATQSIRTMLSRHTPSMSYILYLTSDAGEGKTTIINQVARTQALQFKERKTDWLLVPISLGGRSFLRFDDVIIGALMNRFRFPYLFYDSFVALVKLGVIVPAFDGFEELFVEGPAGEAVSALSHLLKALDGEGEMLIAARKAYFEFKDFAAQGRLLDGMPDVVMSFANLRLDRWGEKEFLQYCTLRGVADCQKLYESAVARLGSREHSLLTRAVLAKRLVDVLEARDERDAVLGRLRPEADEYYATFVEAIIEREAVLKWIDKSGDPASPLLTARQHCDLLANVAEEMWINQTGVLREDVIELVAEVFCKEAQLPPKTSHQVIQRVKHHALLAHMNEAQREVQFDHEEFAQFFLGLAVYRTIMRRSEVPLRSLLRPAALPSRCLDIASTTLRKQDAGAIRETIDFLCHSASVEGAGSFCRENAGALLVRLLDAVDGGGLTVQDVVLPVDALMGRVLRGIRFERCQIQPTALSAGALNQCQFVGCHFERLDLPTGTAVAECTIDEDSDIYAVVPEALDVSVFDPGRIRQYLVRTGFSIENAAAEGGKASSQEIPHDQGLVATERAVRLFHRSTYTTESLFKAKLGRGGNEFTERVLPDLLRAGVIVEVQWGGSGKDRRFKLGMKLADFHACLAQSEGTLDGFLAAVSRNRVRG